MALKFDLSQILALERESKLRNVLKSILWRFPKTFDSRLRSGLDRLVVNSSENFISERSTSHLTRLLVIQFFLQKRMEAALGKKDFRLFTKFFRTDSHICLIAVLPCVEEEQLITQDHLIKSMQTVVPGVYGIADSFWGWLHPEFPYMSLYIEMQRLRGKEISAKETHFLRDPFEEQLLHILHAPTSSVFWPFNEEEAYKQIQVLQRELSSPDDQPQATIHLRQRSTHSLEFIVNLVRPASKRISDLSSDLTSSLCPIFSPFLAQDRLPVPQRSLLFFTFFTYPLF